MSKPRIVSLLPSSTEIVCALGFEENLVGRSHECDYPPGINRLPSLTAPKFNPDGRSYEIDQRVKAVLQEAVSVYQVDADLLRTLQPDIIVTQAQCEVCAVSLDEVRRVACDYLGLPAEVIALEPNRLDDVLADFVRVADALGAPERGYTLVNDIKAQMAEIAERARDLPRPTVATIEWIDPLMAAGNWVPELIEMAGGRNLFGRSGEHSPWMSFDALRDADPDVITIMPCGFDIPRSLDELSALTERREWQELRAMQTGRVYVTDGNQYFNRPGPRLLESLQILAEILHPDAFDFGHEGVGWQTLQVKV